eukprot:209271-Rhodomonas_salina.3
MSPDAHVHTKPRSVFAHSSPSCRRRSAPQRANQRHAHGIQVTPEPMHVHCEIKGETPRLW